MAESKYTRSLSLMRGLEPAEVETPAPPPVELPLTKEGKRGRPATGKRSDPAYETTTVFLKGKTKRDAARLLIDRPKVDLSDVLEELLADWVKQHS